MTFCDWSAAYSLTIHCSCLRKSRCLSSWALMGIEQTIWSGLCLISASVYQRSRKRLQLKSKRRKRWCQWRTMVRRPRMFQWALLGYASLKKSQISWLAEHCLVLLFRQPASLYRSTVCVHTNMHVVCVYLIHQTVTGTTGPLTCLHDLLLHAYTHAVLLLGCGIAEVPLNIFIGCINGRLSCLSICRKWEWPAFFNNQCSLFLFLFFWSAQ